MNHKSLLLAFFLTLGFTAGAAEHTSKPYVGSKAFERVKSLAGTWEWELDMGQGPMTFKSIYKVTSGGSSVVETTMAGTPMEMVTIYHDNSKKRLTMTHYCMLHNQPKLVFKSLKENKLSMQLAKNADIDVAKEEHMHAMILTFVSKDKIIQNWSNFKGGKLKHAMDMEFERVK